ncbi:MAG: thiopurine S-methyltransferase [Pseudomonas sp.]|uniref:thiopurine S-methyltransferase n=1 Tax=Pseudomonas sp. TaxID=306 RepID=UPI0027346CB5|nr:thiopurine S-methyltransferase [Pseudomonas sp.]MDP3844909.1 thiopurine S-methyltransferase [Pseudomonas sp.]
MHQDFWQQRWARNEIGFHLSEVNPYLQRFWPALNVAPGTQVLVPLCGKSLDMLWLAEQGYRVLGVELAQAAVEAFFSEQDLAAEIDQVGEFRRYRSGAIEVLCGDFFSLTAADLLECRALYDRAALIALPAPLRERYAAHLASILPSGCGGLLVVLDYPQEQMPGPPFAVGEVEVQRLLAAPQWSVQVLEARDVLGENWRFLQRGLSQLSERVYRLQRG